MSAYDRFHLVVRNALVKDGWTITHDPLRLEIGERSLQVDLGAERLLAAERGTERIAVEIKSFTSASDIADLRSWFLRSCLIFQGLRGRASQIEFFPQIHTPLFIGRRARQQEIRYLRQLVETHYPICIWLLVSMWCIGPY